jgi:hypothetical protein
MAEEIRAHQEEDAGLGFDLEVYPGVVKEEASD